MRYGWEERRNLATFQTFGNKTDFSMLSLLGPLGKGSSAQRDQQQRNFWTSFLSRFRYGLEERRKLGPHSKLLETRLIFQRCLCSALWEKTHLLNEISNNIISELTFFQGFQILYSLQLHAPIIRCLLWATRKDGVLRRAGRMERLWCDTLRI